MVCMLSKHKRSRPAQPTPGSGCSTPPVSSTQKRARRPSQPTTSAIPTAAPEPNWSSLSPDLVRRVGNRILAADDIDYYMAFRVVCHNWRRALKDDDHLHHPDDCFQFQPSKWAMLDRHDDVLAFVNLETGRFLSKRIPLLRDYFFVGTTSGGLVVLGESTYPYRAIYDFIRRKRSS